MPMDSEYLFVYYECLIIQWREYWLIYVYVTILSLPKNIDMILRVPGVKASVGGKLLLSVFENVFVRDYLAQLNPKHCPPYRLERIHIIECMIDYVKLELGLIMAECHMELLSGFFVWDNRLLDRFSSQAAVWLLCCRYDCWKVWDGKWASAVHEQDDKK